MTAINQKTCLLHVIFFTFLKSLCLVKLSTDNFIHFSIHVIVVFAIVVFAISYTTVCTLDFLFSFLKLFRSCVTPQWPLKSLWHPAK